LGKLNMCGIFMWHLTKKFNGGATDKKGIELQGENPNSET